MKASELSCFEQLVSELRRRAEFANIDSDSLHVWAYESYEQELKNVDTAIQHLDRWLYMHNGQNEFHAFDGGQLMTKKEFACLGSTIYAITSVSSKRWL